MRQKMREEQEWHRVTYIFIQNMEGKFIVQTRNNKKEYCPGALDLATGIVVSPNDDDDLKEMAELEEKIGVKNSDGELKFIGSEFFIDNKI